MKRQKFTYFYAFYLYNSLKIANLFIFRLRCYFLTFTFMKTLVIVNGHVVTISKNNIAMTILEKQ